MLTFSIATHSYTGSVTDSVIDCETLKGKSCVYIPSLSSGIPTRALVYHRGHLGGKSDFSATKRMKSALDIINYKQFGLVNVANKKNLLLIVNGSSRVHLSKKDLLLVLNKYQIQLDELYVAAHSGGYAGMNHTLRHLGSQFFISKIIMLDSYYSTKPKGLLEIMPKILAKGTACVGFHTRHNKERYEKFYNNDKVHCDSDGPRGMNHNDSVGPVLSQSIY